MEEEETGSGVHVETVGKVGRAVSSATWQLKLLAQLQSNSGEGGPY